MATSDFFADAEGDALLASVDLESLGAEAAESQLQAADFGFPFEPYAIQLRLMRRLYCALRDARCGIFESPTGTGKSLSLLCGSLTWLRHEIERQRRWLTDQRPPTADADAENWVAQFAARIDKQRRHDEQRREIESRLAALQRLLDVRDKHATLVAAGGASAASSSAPNGVDADADASDEDELPPDDEPGAKPPMFEEEEEEEDEPTKIFYASRTHSQLAQFCREFARTPHARSVSAVCLASRQSLCINASVRKLQSAALMGERCLELQRGARSAGSPQRKRRKLCSSCPYFRRSAIAQLAEAALCSPLDIEDLVARGRKLQACPYYAARRAASLAQLVLLPYHCVVHAPTRRASGIRLAGQVVIIDEAHNLLDTVAAAHSHSVSADQLLAAAEQLRQYEARYRSRLGANNLLLLRHLQLLLRQLLAQIGRCAVHVVTDFHLRSGIDNLDLHSLLRRMRDTRIARRVCGVAASAELAADGLSRQAPLQQLQAFVESILSDDDDGRVLVGEKHLKFLLLNPGRHFAEVVRQARSVVLAGGTMQPVQEAVSQLFVPAGCSSSSVELFSCGHVVGKDAVMALTVGSSGSQTLRFTHEMRNSAQMLCGAGRALERLLAATPCGAVLFFPSYDWEQRAYTRWEQDGTLARIRANKRVFRESRTQWEQQLQRFQAAASAGAVLFAVVGGRLSEGINFSDDLGRCVLMLGMPYPNAQSPELAEKMSYLDANLPPIEPGRSAGQSHYANLCMRAVNQCVGRAIRHRGDYAAIVFLDCRYARADVADKLPSWIGQSLVPGLCADDEAADRLRNFFAEKISPQ